MAAGAVTPLLAADDDPEHLLRRVLSDFEVEVLETSPVAYQCYCSRERVESALISLGAVELQKILEEQGGCELTCQFCDAIYKFTAPELERLIVKIRAMEKSKKTEKNSNVETKKVEKSNSTENKKENKSEKKSKTKKDKEENK